MYDEPVQISSPSKHALLRVIFVCLTMLLLAVMTNATMDTLTYRYHRSVFTHLGNTH